MYNNLLIQTDAYSCCICEKSYIEKISSGIDFEYNTCKNTFSYFRCKSCENIFIFDRPLEKEVSVIYPLEYGNYSNSLKPSFAFRVKTLLEKHKFKSLIRKLKANSSVLDIGCGDARLLDVFKNIRSKNLYFYGQEISSNTAKVAQSKGYFVYEGPFENIDLGNNKYDLITMIQVIEHFLDPNIALRKIYHHIKDDGIVLLETPSTVCWDFYIFKKRYWGGYHIPRHINIFNPNNIVLLAKKNKFQVISIKAKLQPVHWIWNFHHYFMEKKWPEFFYKSFNIKNPFWLTVFTILESIQVFIFKKSSNMQVILKKY